MNTPDTTAPKPYGYTDDATTIALPSQWECAYGPFDDEPFCQETEDDGHTCPTIRVHRDDAEKFAALVDRVHELTQANDRQRGVLAEANRAIDRARANAAHWRNRYHAESCTKWDDGLPPGGEVCAAPDCGQPVESEPCPEHNPRAIAERLQKRLHDAAMTRTWTNEDGKKFVFVEDIAPALLDTGTEGGAR